MLRYTDYQVVFREIPNCITLAINISNCPNHCPGCHSPELREDIGTELTDNELIRIIQKNIGINCVCFMGEGKDLSRIAELVCLIKDKYPLLETALYTGSEDLDDSIFNGCLDYLKTGPYIKSLGPLNKKTTNQRFYWLDDGKRVDMTYLFWD